jgi:asparagine synthase (glutamine-hydrolysing)
MLQTRLKIIDLSSAGDQPFLSFNKKYVGIVNGELYDYGSHKENLLKMGVTFKSQSDSEVLLNLFAQLGAEAIAKTSGEWAFIFYEKETQTLHFARDRHGVKPLFYQWTPESFTLSSELKALSEQKPEINENFVKTLFAHTLLTSETTLKDCYHVLPGRLYSFDIKNQKLNWIHLETLPLHQERTLRGEEAVEATHEALKKAVKKRLVADVEIGTYLSGGIDSSLITAMAVSMGARPKAFTVGFSDLDFDERTLANSVSEHLGIEQNVCILTGKNFFENLTNSIVAYENPIMNPHGAAKNLLSHLASQSVKVVLTGEGADEWFGGYAYFRIAKILEFAKKHPQLGYKLIDNFLSLEGGRSVRHLDGTSLVNESVIKEYFSGFQPAVLGRLNKHRAYEYLTGESLNHRLHKICANLKDYFKEDLAHSGVGLNQLSLNQWDLNTWCALRVDMLHYILANMGDRQEMSHSIEGRTPFLDSEVIQVASQIEPNQHLRSLKEKSILKEISKKYLPADVLTRRKKPFFAPAKYFYLRNYREPIQNYIEQAREATPWLNWKNLDRLLGDEKSIGHANLKNMRNSTRMILFSIGVLMENLRKEGLKKPTGYEIPQSGQDLNRYEIKF